MARLGLLVTLFATMLLLATGCGGSSPTLQLKNGPITEEELREYLLGVSSEGDFNEGVLRLCNLSRNSDDATTAGFIAELLSGPETADATPNPVHVARAAEIVRTVCQGLLRF